MAVAITPYDYKDGLIYLDDGIGNGLRGNNPSLDASLKQDGVARDSKLMWALGNFSRFVRPGMVRVEIASSTGVTDPGLLVSAYRGDGREVVVVVNLGNRGQNFRLDGEAEKYRVYETSESSSLKYRGETGRDKVSVPARSVVTLVSSGGI